MSGTEPHAGLTGLHGDVHLNRPQVGGIQLQLRLRDAGLCEAGGLGAHFIREGRTSPRVRGW